MRPGVFVKRYDTASRCAAAHANYVWLAGLNAGVRLPRVVRAGRRTLVFEFLPGRPGCPQDLQLLAAVVGRLDAAAHRHGLESAHLDEPYRPPSGPIIDDFVSPRRTALERAAAQAGLDPVDVHAGVEALTDRPAAIYKDANPRNFLVTGAAAAIVDFDNLTLAPFGYDLAKLVVTTSMTYGPLETPAFRLALDSYNAQIQPRECQVDDFKLFAELHHLLTARYIGRGGYRYPWPAVRPWPKPSRLGRRTAPATENPR